MWNRSNHASVKGHHHQVVTECTDVVFLEPIPHLLVLVYLIISVVDVSCKDTKTFARYDSSIQSHDTPFLISVFASETKKRFLVTCILQFPRDFLFFSRL
jgi:hypothetical protein